MNAPVLAYRGIPSDARVVQLRDGLKEPATAHGHHSSDPVSDFFELGQNVGIVLDGQYIAVDLDRPDTLEGLRLAKQLDGIATWRQKTPHGRHWLFRTPAGLAIGNVKLRAADGSTFGDIKTLGYIVAPESAVGGIKYLLEAELDPIAAPPWVLETARSAARSERTALESAGGREGIPRGSHDDSIVSLTGFMRGQLGLTPTAIARALQGGIVSVLEDYDPRRPYTPEDFARIARQAERWKPGLSGEVSGILAADWDTYGTPEILPPTQWWAWGFIPKGALTLLYGRPGIGKTTLAGWLAALVQGKGGTFAAVAREDSKVEFETRMHLAGADPARILRPATTAIRLPRDIEALRSAIESQGIDVLYFDSFRGLLAPSEGDGHEADRTRAALEPLGELCQQTGCTIVGTFHPGKSGEYIGSTELEAIARSFLVCSRGSDPTAPARTEELLELRQRKTNGVPVEYALQFRIEGRTLEVAGRTQMTEDAEGNLVPQTFPVAVPADNLSIHAIKPERIADPKPPSGSKSKRVYSEKSL